MPKATVELDVPDLAPAAAVDPGRTVVLVVDLQNESCHPEGANYHGPEADEAVANTAALVDHARAQGSRVVWVEFVHTLDQAPFSVYGRRPYRLDGTWNAEITKPLSPSPDEKLVRKYSYDVFNDTDFEAYLKGEGIRGPVWSFIVVGASFTGCVHLAVMGLSMRGYRVLVPMDCVSPRTGDRAMVTLHRVGHPNYSFNVTPLVGWESISFDKAVETDPKGIPCG